jgi:hypothetical protein
MEEIPLAAFFFACRFIPIKLWTASKFKNNNLLITDAKSLLLGPIRILRKKDLKRQG